MTQGTIKKGRKFDQVLEGARTIFLKDGFEGASVDDISREAGVSKATLYSYFPDKRSLFIEVASQEMTRVAETGAADLDLSQPPEIVLPFVGRKILDYVLSDFGIAIYRISIAESERFPEIGSRFYKAGPQLVRDKIATYLRSCAARGEVEIKDFELAAEQFTDLCKVRTLLCCVLTRHSTIESDEQNKIIASAVAMFMSHYGAKK